jgi:hypothetical protein
MAAAAGLDCTSDKEKNVADNQAEEEEDESSGEDGDKPPGMYGQLLMTRVPKSRGKV